MIDHLIKEITDAMKETSPVLTAFDLFNPNSLNKSTEKHKQDLEVLCQHYGQVLIDDYEHVTVTARGGYRIFFKYSKKKIKIIYAHNANGVILPGRERLRHVRYMNKCFYWSHDNAFKKLSL